MDKIKLLHNDAMNLAEEAFIAKKKGYKEEAKELFKEAFDKEKEAALLSSNDYDLEPTRSILLRSAASLALRIGEFKEVEKLISTAITGNPPDDILAELRELWDQAQFERHLKLNGIELDYNQVQLSLAGGEFVGYGVILGEIFTDKIEFFRKLIERTLERLLGQSYRTSGLPKTSIRNKFPIYLSTSRAQSYAVTIKVGLSKQLELPYESSLKTNVVDEILACLKLINDADIDSLKSRITDHDYYANFVGLARKLAPDGTKIKQVGFTSIQNGSPDYFLLNPKNLLPEAPKPEVSDTNEPIEIEGYLRFANATKGSHEIRLIDEKGRMHKIEVPVALMNDIVKPLWDSRVLVKGVKRENNSILLADIDRID